LKRAVVVSSCIDRSEDLRDCECREQERREREAQRRPGEPADGSFQFGAPQSNAQEDQGGYPWHQQSWSPRDPAEGAVPACERRDEREQEEGKPCFWAP